MPLPSRDHGAAPVSPGADGYLRDRALDVLLAPDLAHVVALVCWLEKGLVHVADARGHVALRADGTATVLAGRDPIADQDPYADTSYPFAAQRLRSEHVELVETAFAQQLGLARVPQRQILLILRADRFVGLEL